VRARLTAWRADVGGPPRLPELAPNPEVSACCVTAGARAGLPPPVVGNAVVPVTMSPPTPRRAHALCRCVRCRRHPLRLVRERGGHHFRKSGGRRLRAGLLRLLYTAIPINNIYIYIYICCINSTRDVWCLLGVLIRHGGGGARVSTLDYSAWERRRANQQDLGAPPPSK
jgi:hypothetical protein